MDITTTKVVNGHWTAADNGVAIGRVKGDVVMGYWAFTVDGHRLPQPFTSVAQAAEVLALEVRMGAEAMA